MIFLFLILFFQNTYAQNVTSSFDKNMFAVNPAAVTTRAQSLFSLSQSQKNVDSDVSKEYSSGAPLEFKEKVRLGISELRTSGAKSKWVPELYLGYNDGRKTVTRKGSDVSEVSRMSFLDNFFNLGYKNNSILSTGLQIYFPTIAFKASAPGRTSTNVNFNYAFQSKYTTTGFAIGTTISLLKGFYFGVFGGIDKQKDSYSTSSLNFTTNAPEDYSDSSTYLYKRYGVGLSVLSGDAKQKGFRFESSLSMMNQPVSDRVAIASSNGRAMEIKSALEFALTSYSFGLNVCAMLGIPQHQSLKALAYKAITGEKEQIVLMFLLGDDNLNEVKLIGATKADHVKMLSEAELSQYGLVKGFMGPFGLDPKVEIFFDQCVDLGAGYVVGAQKTDFHMQNFIPSRDVKNSKHVDLRMANAGDLTIDGKGVVEIKKGIEVGHVFQLGDKYTKALSVTVLDQNGKAATPIMGCYGIGVTRVVAAAIEQQHDQDGIIWPISIAPYQVYFATIAKSPETEKIAEEIYQELLGAGIEVIYDDRKVGPGFKFKDADLLGIPVQLVLGERDFAVDGCLELKTRNKKINTKVKRSDILAEVKKVIKELGGK